MGAEFQTMNRTTQELWSRGDIGDKEKQPRLLFASVHEDAGVERAALNRAPRGADGQHAFCIASGGDTALALLLENASVRAVDINPAQIALCELKTCAIQTLNPAQFQDALQNDARPLWRQLRSQLSIPTQKFWDENERILARGLAFCGRAEGVFGVGAKLWEAWLGQSNVRDFFGAQTVDEARHIFRSRWNQARWRLVFRFALHPSLLRAIYARGFLHDLPRAFSWRVRRRIEDALLKVAPVENPYAALTFRGRFSGHENGWPLYARRDNLDILRRKLNGADWSLECGECAAILEASAPDSLQFFALSNVLDAASPTFGERLLSAVAKAGSPGALVCLRAISSPPLAALDATASLFENDEALAGELRALDQSLFCPLVTVLRVR